MERENIEARLKIQSTASSQADQKIAAAVTEIAALLGSVDCKNNLDNYLLRFETYATIAGWQQDTQAVRPRPLLIKKSIGCYSRLSCENARNYNKLREAFTKQKLDFTEQGYRERFETLN